MTKFITEGSMYILPTYLSTDLYLQYLSLPTIKFVGILLHVHTNFEGGQFSVFCNFIFEDCLPFRNIHGSIFDDHISDYIPISPTVYFIPTQPHTALLTSSHVNASNEITKRHGTYFAN